MTPDFDVLHKLRHNVALYSKYTGAFFGEAEVLKVSFQCLESGQDQRLVEMECEFSRQSLLEIAFDRSSFPAPVDKVHTWESGLLITPLKPAPLPPASSAAC